METIACSFKKKQNVPYKNCLLQMLALTNTHPPFTTFQVSLLPFPWHPAYSDSFPLSGPRPLPRDSRGTVLTSTPAHSAQLCNCLSPPWTKSNLRAMPVFCFYLPRSYPAQCEARGRYVVHVRWMQRNTHRKQVPYGKCVVWPGCLLAWSENMLKQ